MVRALLDDSKTQTRRIAKLTDAGHVKEPGGHRRWHPGDPNARLSCPYGQPGDRLWVRETWIWNGSRSGAKGPIDIYLTYTADDQRVTLPAQGDEKFPEQPLRRDDEVYSLRDAPDDFVYNGSNTYIDRLTRWWGRKIPSIHMPRWASRITLEITSERIERLQDISEEDAIAEGIFRLEYGGQISWRDYSLDDEWAEVSPMLENPVDSYRTLWDSINGTGSWAANQLVWAVEFKRVKP